MDGDHQLGRQASFRLGAAEVRPSACEVAGPNGVEAVEPRVMQVLIVLARAGGATVTRDDLIATCWGGRFVSTHAVNRVILKIRRLAEGPCAGAFTLQTIPKVGYRLRFAAAAQPEAAPTALEPSAPAQRRLRPSRRALWVAAGVAVASLTVAVLASEGGDPRRTPTTPRSATVVRDAVAEDLAHRARAAVFEGTPAQLAQGVGYFREAVARAPGDADLWGSLAMAETLNLPNHPPAEQPAAAERIRQAARRALEIDPREPHGWASQAALEPTYRAWAAKEAVVARAVAGAAPRAPSPLRQQVLFLAEVGRSREALVKAERLHRVHPMVPFIAAEHIALLTATDRWLEAAKAAEAARALWPREAAVWRARYALALRSGDAAGARAMALDRATWPADVREVDMRRRADLAAAVASGAPADADRMADAYRRAAAEGQGYLEEGIFAAAALRRADLAFELAERLYGPNAPAERFRHVTGADYAQGGDRPVGVWFGPFAERLWTDPRFLPLMSRLGLVAYWREHGAPDLCAWPEMQAACRNRGATEQALTPPRTAPNSALRPSGV